MASLIRRTYTKVDPKTGKRVRKKTRKWYGQFVDADGTTKRVPLCADKAAAQAMLAELVRKTERKRAGIIDKTVESSSIPISQHIEDFKRHLRTKELTEKYVKNVISRVSILVNGCGFKQLRDLEATSVSEWLAEARDGNPHSYSGQPLRGIATSYAEICSAFGVTERTVSLWRKKGAPIDPKNENDIGAIWQWRQEQQAKIGGISRATSNCYLHALKLFVNWLCDEDRICENPLRRLKDLKAGIERRHRRRSISADDFHRLVEVTFRSPKVFRGLNGTDRAMLYLVATNTGLRARELASIRCSDLNLTANPPTITVEAAFSKSRRRDVQPIRADIARVLDEWAQNRPEKQLWPGRWYYVAAQMLRRDLSLADIPYVDESGGFFDFHSLRHQFISNLARAGVHPKLAQILARHTKISLTMDCYTHLDIGQAAAALDELPELPCRELEILNDPNKKRLAPSLAPKSDSHRRDVSSHDTGCETENIKKRNDGGQSTGELTSFDRGGQSTTQSQASGAESRNNVRSSSFSTAAARDSALFPRPGR